MPNHYLKPFGVLFHPPPANSSFQTPCHVSLAHKLLILPTYIAHLFFLCLSSLSLSLIIAVALIIRRFNTVFIFLTLLLYNLFKIIWIPVRFLFGFSLIWINCSYCRGFLTVWNPDFLRLGLTLYKFLSLDFSIWWKKLWGFPRNPVYFTQIRFGFFSAPKIWWCLIDWSKDLIIKNWFRLSKLAMSGPLDRFARPCKWNCVQFLI